VNPNPPIRGHELKFEGHRHSWIDRLTDDYARDENGAIRYDGGCRCGATPDGWPDITAQKVKRWHREHKAEIRAERGQP